MENLNLSQKADKARGALSQLHEELDIGLGSNNRQRMAIRNYLKAADDYSLARLFDIVTGNGDEPLGATESIGSIAP